MSVKIFKTKKDSTGLLSQTEAISLGIKTIGLHLASIKDVENLLLSGNDEVFMGKINVKEGIFEFSIDEDKYKEAITCTQAN